MEKIMFRNDERIYKYPLHQVTELNDLREMAENSAEKFADRNAYFLKDPVALRELDPRSEEAQKFKINPKDEYRGISYSEFNNDRLALGTSLHNQGLNMNEKVVILSETRYEWYVSYLTVVSGLAVVCPMDIALMENELENLLNRSEASTIFFTRKQESKLKAIKDKLKFAKHFISYDLPSEDTKAALPEGAKLDFFWDLIDEGNLLRDKANFEYDKLPINRESLAVLLFTSGTTSTAKAVMLSHKNLITNIMDSVRMIQFDENDSVLSVLPLHHTYEATAGFLIPHYFGGTVAICDGLRHITHNMQQAQVTVMIAVPLLLETIYKQVKKKIEADENLEKKFNLAVKVTRFLNRFNVDIRKKVFKNIHDTFGGKLRYIICGGAAIEPQILRELNEWGLNAFQGYGLTESSPIFAVNRPYYHEDAATGLPLPSTEVKIINPDDRGIGEIIGRGPSIMIGYYQDEALTRKAIDADGFYHTGDYGYIDDRNFVYITGREANIIVTKNGKNIFPEEIESIMQQEDPIIAEIVVYGERDASGDQVITAEVYPNAEIIEKDPHLKGEALTSDKVRKRVHEVINSANLNLVPYKRVKALELRDEPFPRNTSRKILRNKAQRNVDTVEPAKPEN